MDLGNKSRRIGLKGCNSNKREKVNLPVRTLIKNGVIDRSKVYYILKNPEEPKCKVTISALLKQYQEHRRKALNVSRNSNFDDSTVKNLDLLIEGNVELDQLPQEFRQNLFLDNFTDSESNGSSSCCSTINHNKSINNNVMNNSTDESSSSDAATETMDEKVQSKSSVFNLNIG